MNTLLAVSNSDSDLISGIVFIAFCAFCVWVMNR